MAKSSKKGTKHSEAVKPSKAVKKEKDKASKKVKPTDSASTTIDSPSSSPSPLSSSSPLSSASPSSSPSPREDTVESHVTVVSQGSVEERQLRFLKEVLEWDDNTFVEAERLLKAQTMDEVCSWLAETMPLTRRLKIDVVVTSLVRAGFLSLTSQLKFVHSLVVWLSQEKVLHAAQKVLNALAVARDYRSLSYLLNFASETANFGAVFVPHLGSLIKAGLDTKSLLPLLSVDCLNRLFEYAVHTLECQALLPSVVREAVLGYRVDEDDVASLVKCLVSTRLEHWQAPSSSNMAIRKALEDYPWVICASGIASSLGFQRATAHQKIYVNKLVQCLEIPLP